MTERHAGVFAPSDPIAHTRNPDGTYHLLRDHLLAVAELASRSADAFNAGELAYWAGLWHDLGKLHPDFQQYLYNAEADPRRFRRGPDHKAAGTCLAVQNKNLHLLAFGIAGHHGGLPDRAGKLTAFLHEHCGSERVREALEAAQHILETLDPGEISPPAFVSTPEEAELFIRMLFSCLVDADFVDTERHFSPEVARQRVSDLPRLEQLWSEFEADQLRFAQDAPATAVNDIRDEIYRYCLERSSEPPGFFRLTVPTGGGKTRSGLAFALRHAVQHDLRRVIIAVPYTSITEQTADTYRGIFSDARAVLEHHSAVEPEEHDDETYRDWAQLAAQNWDAPIIVTTTVQLLESLFANRTSRCRKLHNIARSVILLDEVQSLPPGVIQPTLDVLRQLVEHYGVTVVLSTATQPALDERTGFPGLPGIREIVPDPGHYFRQLRRVTYHRPSKELTWDDVAEHMMESEQAMTIVNTRKDARTLFEVLDDPEALHLSTLMCGVHRRQVLEEVRRRLADGEPCRLVSTQLVEAGVDLDFPLVLRAVAPMDRIVQAAGRCNREGKRETGDVVIFDPAGGSQPEGEYRTGTDLTRSLFSQGYDDLHDPAIYQIFFERLYRNVTLDSRKVAAARREFNFPAVADRYRIIDEDTFPVVVPWEGRRGERPASEALATLQSGHGDPRAAWRALQHYVVGLSNWQLKEAERRGTVIQIRDGLWQLTPMGTYDPRLGLLLEKADAGALVF